MDERTQDSSVDKTIEDRIALMLPLKPASNIASIIGGFSGVSPSHTEEHYNFF